MNCAKCGELIRICDDPVTCVGKCKSRFHQVCTPLTKITAKVVNDNVNIVFKCGSCLLALDDGVNNNALGELTKEIDELSSISKSLTDNRGSIDKQISCAIQSGMENFLKSFNESLRESMANIEASVARKLDDFKKVLIDRVDRDTNLGAINRKRARTERAIHSESDSNPSTKKLIVSNKHDKPIENRENNEVFLNNTQTYANVLAGSSGIKINKSQNKENRKTRPVIVIKPVESSQSSEQTRLFLKQKLDPKIHKIGNFRNGKNGSIIAECAIGDDVEGVKNDIASNLGDKYNAVIPIIGKPKLKIMGMSDRYSPDEFIDLLKSQNDNIGINEVKVIADFENPRFKYNKFNVIIEVDKDTYNCLMNAGKVSIGWDKCSVQEAINVLRCFKCGEFGHKSTECANTEACSKCCEKHKSSECSSTEFKCVNCLKANRDLKLNLDVKHPASSAQCPVFRRLYEKRKSNMLSSK